MAFFQINYSKIQLWKTHHECGTVSLIQSICCRVWCLSNQKKMQLYNNLGLRPLPVFSLYQFQETPRCDFTRWLNESTWCHGYLQTCTQVHRIKAVNHVLGCIVEVLSERSKSWNPQQAFWLLFCSFAAVCQSLKLQMPCAKNYVKKVGCKWAQV